MPLLSEERTRLPDAVTITDYVGPCRCAIVEQLTYTSACGLMQAMARDLPVIIPISLPQGLISIFEKISAQSGAFLLDSAGDNLRDGRYSFAGINPIHTFSSNGGFITMDGHTVIDGPRDSLQRLVAMAERIPSDTYLPFTGGLVGFISFEWGNARGDIEGSALMPDTSFGLYDTIVTCDHLENIAWVSSIGLKKDGSTDVSLAQRRAEEFAGLLLSAKNEMAGRSIFKSVSRYPVVSSVGKDQFISAVEALKNLGHSPLFAPMFRSPTQKTPWNMYLELRSGNPTPFSAYINGGDFHILSSSRTCLLEVSGGIIKTKPTKGVLSRGTSDEYDRSKINELTYDDEKQASHRFLVTEMMNALDGVCEPGTVEPVEVAKIESDSKAHHLVSNVTGWKRSYANAIDCLFNLIPRAGSESSIRNVISRLECSQRNVYTGAIGFVGSGGKAEFNLAFRTMVLKDSIGYLHAGTEVTHLTDPEEAYIKTNRAADNIFNLIS